MHAKPRQLVLGLTQADFSAVDRAVMSLAAETPQRRATESGNTTTGTAPLASLASRPVPEIATLDSEEWPGIDKGSVLLTPGKCTALWKQLMTESGRAIQQAIAVQVGALLVGLFLNERATMQKCCCSMG